MEKEMGTSGSLLLGQREISQGKELGKATKKSRRRVLAGIGAMLGALTLVLFTLALANHAIAQTCVPSPANLLSWWPGDENANDIVGGNNGTLVNGVTFAPGMWIKHLALME